MTQETISTSANSARARYAFRHVMDALFDPTVYVESHAKDLALYLKDQNLPGHVRLNLFSQWESAKILASAPVRKDFSEIENLLKKGAKDYLQALA